ncbi:MAG: hypothetical protein ACTSYM_06360 [Candidatus Baldrarchaeia archaeon]
MEIDIQSTSLTFATDCRFQIPLGHMDPLAFAKFFTERWEL